MPDWSSPSTSPSITMVSTSTPGCCSPRVRARCRCCSTSTGDRRRSTGSGSSTSFSSMRLPGSASWRATPVEDILAAVDAALARFDRLDPDRMGIMGGSYGGFMTGRILPLDHRWKSAVPERGVYSWTSFAGTSDIGDWFPRNYLGGWGHDDWGLLMQ